MRGIVHPCYPTTSPPLYHLPKSVSDMEMRIGVKKWVTPRNEGPRATCLQRVNRKLLLAIAISHRAGRISPRFDSKIPLRNILRTGEQRLGDLLGLPLFPRPSEMDHTDPTRHLNRSALLHS